MSTISNSFVNIFFYHPPEMDITSDKINDKENLADNIQSYLKNRIVKNIVFGAGQAYIAKEVALNIFKRTIEVGTKDQFFREIFAPSIVFFTMVFSVIIVTEGIVKVLKGIKFLAQRRFTLSYSNQVVEKATKLFENSAKNEFVKINFDKNELKLTKNSL